MDNETIQQEAEESVAEAAEATCEEAAPEAAEAASEEAAQTPQDEDEEFDEARFLRRNRGRRRRRGALVFFCTMCIVVLCFLILFCFAMIPIRKYLSNYEASRIYHTRDAVYETLFADPDWGVLYELAGVEDTVYEGRDAYVSYMESYVGQRELTMTEVADGIANSYRYELRCDGETVAAFTLYCVDETATFPSWKLGTVEVFFTRSETVTVVKVPGQTVYINGIALDDSYTTITVSTLAEDYIPEGLHGYRWEQQQIGVFLVEPEVVVLDSRNNPVEVTYDSVLDVYSTQIPSPEPITDEETQIAVAAAKAQAEFDIRAINISQLRQYFDSSSECYQAICDAEPFVDSFQSYELDESAITVSEFCRYSDQLFCARVSLSMEVKVSKNSTQTYTLDTTYYFTKTNTGAYMVSDSTELHLQTLITRVLVSYCDGETVIHSELTQTGVALTPPEYTDASGNAPIGWGTKNADGTITPVTKVAEPVTLYPIFAQSEEAQ